MFKYSKKLFAILAAASMLFVVACDQQGGSQSKGKSKTLKNTKSKGFVRCGVSQGLPGFSNADAAGIGLVLMLMYVEQLLLQYWVMQIKLNTLH